MRGVASALEEVASGIVLDAGEVSGGDKFRAELARAAEEGAELELSVSYGGLTG